MSQITGGCLCGDVRYESSAEPQMVVVCHCTTCQKNTGSPFSLNVAVPDNEIKMAGDSLRTYEERSDAASPPFYRLFCSRCGSPIAGRGAAYPGLVFLKAGTLDDPSWVRPTVHIWCAEKQPWVAIEEGVAQFEHGPE